jgi:hypothetical protein
MRIPWLWGVVVAGMVLGGILPAQAQKDATRDVFLQTIGLLAGQGLVIGHENLDGIAARFEKKLLPRDRALEALIAARRYTDLVLSAFADRLMGQLTEAEKKDLNLMIGFYETHRQAVNALADYIRSGGNAKKRLPFEEQQARVAAIIRQISPVGAQPGPAS